MKQTKLFGVCFCQFRVENYIIVIYMTRNMKFFPTLDFFY